MQLNMENTIMHMHPPVTEINYFFATICTTLSKQTVCKHLMGRQARNKHVGAPPSERNNREQCNWQ